MVLEAPTGLLQINMYGWDEMSALCLPVGEVVVIDGLVCKEYAGKTNIHLTKMARVLTELGTQQAEDFGRECKEFLQKEEEGGTGTRRLL